MPEKPLLYIEDEETDVMLFQLAMQQARITSPLFTVGDGEQAVAYLQGSGQYANREKYPIPALVLLDLNLPRLSGMKVLEWIRGQPEYADLPVLIYTSSGQPAEQEQAQNLGANDYLVKPVRLEQIAELVRQAKQKWLQPGSPRLG
jgi:CheY-like chemotaxis protein